MSHGGTTPPQVVLAASTPVEDPVPARRDQRWARGTAIGVPVAAIAYLAMITPGFAAPVALLLAASMLVLVPTAPTLARRVVVNGSILVGWLPLLWWRQWPVAFSHGALVLAVGAGLLVGVIAGASAPVAAARRLLPETARADLVIPLGAVAGIAATANLLFARTPERALVLLLPGADNYQHFDMFASIRTYGATLNALGNAEDGSRWEGFHYPQGFHALAASVSELMHPEAGPGPDLLPAYAQAVGVVVVLGVVLITAGVASLPGLRDRPGVLLPAVTVAWAAFLWEPGQHALADGFAPFWLGAAAAGVAVVLAVSIPEWLSTPDLLAIGGLFVTCAHTWAPLLLFAAPAAVVVLTRDRATSRARTSRTRWFAALAVAAVTGWAVLVAALLLLRNVPIGYVVTTQTGGLHGSVPLPVLLMLVVGLYACFRYRPVSPTEGGLTPVERVRIRVAALTPLLGVLVLGVFLVAQLQLLGTTAYYFLKYFIGFELVMAVLTPAVCGLLIVSRFPRRDGPSGRVAVLVATILATQLFGRFPTGTAPLFSTTGEGTAGLGGRLSPAGVAHGVLAAVRGTQATQTQTIEYFPLGPARALNPFYGDAWFHAVQHSLTGKVFQRYGPWRVGSTSVRSAADLIAPVLENEPEVRVVVDPAYVPAVRALLPSPDLRSRVVGWR